jgi:hypothetical protein
MRLRWFIKRKTYHLAILSAEAEARYSNMSETDLIYRCLGIILESIAFTGDQVRADESKIPAPSPFEVSEEYLTALDQYSERAHKSHQKPSSVRSFLCCGHVGLSDERARGCSKFPAS